MGLSEALFYALVFFIATIAADVVFAQLLKRQYLVAPEDNRRDASPTWWTWKPAEAPKQ
jgi:hypothetical protein